MRGPRRNRSLRDSLSLRSKTLRYLLRDEFATALAAGAVNGTAAEPGPGTRTVVDTNGILSIASGYLQKSGAGVGDGDPRDVYPSITRSAGKMFLCTYQLNNASEAMYVGFGAAATGGTGKIVFYLNSTNISFLVPGGITVVIGSTSLDTDTKLVGICRSTGAMFFAELSGIWILLYTLNVDNTATLYPAIRNSGVGANIWKANFLRIPSTLWLPAPLLSTSGAMTWPLTNGLGHAETTGLGSGGSGLTMLDAGTWSVAGGYMLNTPVAGLDVVINGTFAADSDWTKGAPWAISGGNANITGAHAAASMVATVPPLTVGKWYLVNLDLVRTAGIFYVAGGLGSAAPTWNDSGAKMMTARATTTALSFTAFTDAAGNVDNLTCKPLPISNLITNVQLSTTDVLAECVIHAYTLGTQVGMALNLDTYGANLDAGTWNGVLCYFDGVGNIKLDEIKNGVYTNRLSAATAFAADKRLIVRKVGTEYRVFYNEALVGTTALVDAAAMAGKYHGMFSTLAANTITSMVVHDTGNVTNYNNILDRWSN